MGCAVVLGYFQWLREQTDGLRTCLGLFSMAPGTDRWAAYVRGYVEVQFFLVWFPAACGKVVHAARSFMRQGRSCGKVVHAARSFIRAFLVIV
jgi:bacterioferritin-associated ferredoxin